MGCLVGGEGGGVEAATETERAPQGRIAVTGQGEGNARKLQGNVHIIVRGLDTWGAYSIESNIAVCLQKVLEERL